MMKCNAGNVNRRREAGEKEASRRRDRRRQSFCGGIIGMAKATWPRRSAAAYIGKMRGMVALAEDK